MEQCSVTEEAVSDGLNSYPEAVRKRYQNQAKHTQLVSFEDKKNNNIAERLQNTWRRFLHPPRGFKSLKTGGIQIIGFMMFYNFIRKNSAIGMIPAEKAGLIQYYGQKTVKERIQYLIKQAVIFWLYLFNKNSLTHQS